MWKKKHLAPRAGAPSPTLLHSVRRRRTCLVYNPTLASPHSSRHRGEPTVWILGELTSWTESKLLLSFDGEQGHVWYFCWLCQPHLAQQGEPCHQRRAKVSLPHKQGDLANAGPEINLLMSWWTKRWLCIDFWPSKARRGEVLLGNQTCPKFSSLVLGERGKAETEDRGR